MQLYHLVFAMGIGDALPHRSSSSMALILPSFCVDIYGLLKHGRCETVPVLVLMGRLVVRGSHFGLALCAPPLPGNFPLLGLEKKKVALLDGWCFDADVLPLARQLVWYEGKPFPLTRPQNLSTCSGQILYRGTAPVFVTCKDSCKEKDLAPAQDKAHVAVVRGSS